MSASTEHWRVWGQHLAVAAVYAAVYRVAYQLSISHWELTVGLRLGCLLLVPMRLWPALALGELLPVFESALLCMESFGLAWLLAASVPQIVICMAAMKPLRLWGSVRAPDGQVRIGYVLTAALCCALLSALRDTASLWVALMSSSPDGGVSATLATGFSTYLFGGYLGGLTVVPAMLAVQDQMGKLPTFGALWRSSLFRDSCLWLIPVLAMLVWQANNSEVSDVRQLARLAMMLPMAVMAWRYRWHGTAIAGSAASVALALTSHAVRDPAVMYCQVALALAISAGLIMGGKASLAAHAVLQKS
ncbi:MASE1 domain-containing protein [Luteibacter aegosomaticola]|uniref:MASE1 domain-containing protein n=1 Tax=Luteibacter aegosomaticola TaxID=2911538 RepID=UPI001FF99935|nr:MASE1 domain-containing protein [Luteibacter aegosomaticola]UPG88501.1 MASE1 domain-containing protein [Luteibacter aegosomaticola]